MADGNVKYRPSASAVLLSVKSRISECDWSAWSKGTPTTTRVIAIPPTAEQQVEANVSTTRGDEHGDEKATRSQMQTEHVGPRCNVIWHR